jgi:hypothetical protein
MSINLHIERLILDGLPMSRNHGSLVQAAVETELARLLAERGMSHSSGVAVPYLSANSIAVTRENKPAQLGHQIAQAVYNSLTPSSALTHKTHLPGAPHQ